MPLPFCWFAPSKVKEVFARPLCRGLYLGPYLKCTLLSTPKFVAGTQCILV